MTRSGSSPTARAAAMKADSALREAGRAERGVHDGQTATARPQEGAQRHARRLLVLDADVVRPGDAVVAVDEDEPLAVVEAGAHDGFVGRAGDDHRRLGAVVQGLLQSERGVSVGAADAEHHGDAPLILELAGEGADQPRDLRRLKIGHDDADDAGLPPREAAGEVIDVVAELGGGREHPPPRLIGHARARREGARHRGAGHASAPRDLLGAHKGPGWPCIRAQHVMRRHSRHRFIDSILSRCAQLCKPRNAFNSLCIRRAQA